MHIGSGVAFVIKSQFMIQYSHSTLIQFVKVAPGYLSELFHPSILSHTLRSLRQNIIIDMTFIESITKMFPSEYFFSYALKVFNVLLCVKYLMQHWVLEQCYIN